MGNDMVGQIIEEFKKLRPNRTIMKIWNKQKLYVILAVKDPSKWEYEMDPYYTYIEGQFAGISYLDNSDTLGKVLKDQYLIYLRKEKENE